MKTQAVMLHCIKQVAAWKTLSFNYTFLFSVVKSLVLPLVTREIGMGGLADVTCLHFARLLHKSIGFDIYSNKPLQPNFKNINSFLDKENETMRIRLVSIVGFWKTEMDFSVLKKCLWNIFGFWDLWLRVLDAALVWVVSILDYRIQKLWSIFVELWTIYSQIFK